MDLRELPVDDLVLDSNLNLRDRLDQETVERYDEAWDRMPPVAVFEVDGRWLLADGFHRHASAVRREQRMIAAEVHVGSFADALDYAATANLAHGLPLTRAERRRVVETKLRIHPDWSDRRLSDETGIGRELISRVPQATGRGRATPEFRRPDRRRRQDLPVGGLAPRPERAAPARQVGRWPGRPARPGTLRIRRPLGRRPRPDAPRQGSTRSGKLPLRALGRRLGQGGRARPAGRGVRPPRSTRCFG